MVSDGSLVLLAGSGLLVAGGLLLDDVDRDVRAVLGNIPRRAQPAAQVRGETPQDGDTGDGRRRSEQDRRRRVAAGGIRRR